MYSTKHHAKAIPNILCAAAILVSILSIPVHPVHAQPPDDEEEYPWEDWTLDSLDEEDFEEIDPGNTAEVIHISTGLFPTPSPGASIELYFPFVYNDVFNRASGLRSAFIAETTEPFSWRDPYNCPFIEFDGCEEKTILMPGTDEEVEDGYPTVEFSEIGLRLSYHLPLPGVVSVSGAYRHAVGLLYSEDTSRAYLSFDGGMRPFREIGVLQYRQHSVSGSVGLHIPVYGAFLTTKGMTLGSYYYVGGAYSADYALVNRAEQYSQIADAKEQIRYGNRQDTAVLMRRNQPPGFNRYRSSVEVNLGWRVAAEVITFGIEGFFSIPRTSVLEDADWWQYYGGFRMYVGYLWGTGVLWR